MDTQTSSNTAEEYYSWVDVSNTLPRQATRAWSRFENSVRRTQDLWTHTYRCFAHKPIAQGSKRFGVVIAPTALLREHVKALLLTRDYNIFVDGVTNFQSSELNGREEMFYVVAAGLGVWRDGAHERAMFSVELSCYELLASMLPEPIIAKFARPQHEVVVAWNLHKLAESETHSEMGAMGGGGRARFWLALTPLPSPTLDHQHAASEHAQNDQPRWLNDRKVYLICSIYNSTHYFEHTYDKSHHGATWKNPSTRLVCTWHDRSVDCAAGLRALREAWIKLCQQESLCWCAKAHAPMSPTSAA